jgi:hypothetical protein
MWRSVSISIADAIEPDVVAAVAARDRRAPTRAQAHSAGEFMAEIDATAEACRSLKTISTELLPDRKRYDPDSLMNYWFNKMHGGPYRPAYRIADRQLVAAPVWYHEGSDEKQRFLDYSTGWERLHSRIPFGHGSGNVEPLINENTTVVGHVGTFQRNQIYVPSGGKTGLANLWQAGTSIDSLLKRGIPVVAHRYPASASPSQVRLYRIWGPVSALLLDHRS